MLNKESLLVNVKAQTRNLDHRQTREKRILGRVVPDPFRTGTLG